MYLRRSVDSVVVWNCFGIHDMLEAVQLLVFDYNIGIVRNSFKQRECTETNSRLSVGIVFGFFLFLAFHICTCWTAKCWVDWIWEHISNHFFVSLVPYGVSITFRFAALPCHYLPFSQWPQCDKTHHHHHLRTPLGTLKCWRIFSIGLG